MRDFYFLTTKSLILLIFHNFLRKTFYIIDVLMRRISLNHPEEKFKHQFPQKVKRSTDLSSWTHFQLLCPISWNLGTFDPTLTNTLTWKPHYNKKNKGLKLYRTGWHSGHVDIIEKSILWIGLFIHYHLLHLYICSIFAFTPSMLLWSVDPLNIELHQLTLSSIS